MTLNERHDSTDNKMGYQVFLLSQSSDWPDTDARSRSSSQAARMKHQVAVAGKRLERCRRRTAAPGLNGVPVLDQTGDMLGDA